MVYASWSEWDKSGNGQAVYFARSLDNGEIWEEPIRLAERVSPEYERYWTNMILLGPNQIVAMWEGGYRAYRYAMYSSDSGATWSEPIDTFPYLIGENGFIETERDSLGRIHLFVAQRVREDHPERGKHIGMWHSLWMGGNVWQEPALAWGDIPMVNPKVAIVGGNQVVAAWYSNENLEVMAMNGLILDAPSVAPEVLPTAEPTFQPTLTPTLLIPTRTPRALSSAGLPGEPGEGLPVTTNPMVMVMIGLVPAVLLIGVILTLRSMKREG
jgi:hypothetical protein